jgi:streptogramin lyase
MLSVRRTVRRFAPAVAVLVGLPLASLGLNVGAAVAASGPGTVTVYPYNLDSPFYELNSIALGSDGQLWITAGEDAVGAVTTTGDWSTPYNVGAPNPPYGIVPAADGGLWIAGENTSGGSTIREIYADGTVTPYFMPYSDPRFEEPLGLAVASDGALWFTNRNWNVPEESIGRISTTGVITSYPVAGFGLGAIAAGPDGAMWFTDADTASIGRIITSGAITHYATNDPDLTKPSHIVTGPDGALWFTDADSNAIGRITKSGSVTRYDATENARSIVAGPDGALWFGGGSIGRITTSGSVTLYPASSAEQLVAGPDAAMWFISGNGVGRMTTTESLPTRAYGVTAVAGNGAATVHWSAPLAEGGSAVNAYVVTPYVGFAAQAPQTFNSTATSQVVTGLTNGTPYSFTVTARNAKGSGPESLATGAVVIGAPIAPSTPPTAVPGNSQATVTWTAQAASNGSPITGYVIRRLKSGSDAGTITVGSTVTSATLGGLTNGDTYTFKFAAKNARGTGVFSPASTPPIIIGSPTSPTAVSVSPGDARVVLRWTTPGSNNGSSINGYVITPYIGTAKQTSMSFNSTATTETVTGLTNATTYTFTVAAKNARGIGPSATSSAVTVGPPVANAGADATVSSGAKFVLDASGSSDPNHQPLTFHWDQIGGPLAVIDDPSKSRPQVTAPKGPVTLTFRVTVTNSGGAASSTDSVVITVKAPK